MSSSSGAPARRFLVKLKTGYLEKLKEAKTYKEILEEMEKQYSSQLPGLELAVEKLSEFVPDLNPIVLFKQMVTWVIEDVHTEHEIVSFCIAGTSCCSTFSRILIRRLLAAAFLGIPLKSDIEAGELWFGMLLCHADKISVEKTICILAYFYYFYACSHVQGFDCSDEESQSKSISFIRHSQTEDEHPDWTSFTSCRVEKKRQYPLGIHGRPQRSSSSLFR